MDKQPIPTFDDWYAAKYGASFDDSIGYPLVRVDDYMYALGKAMRDYISEVARHG